jgi:putative membrane protein
MTILKNAILGGALALGLTILPAASAQSPGNRPMNGSTMPGAAESGADQNGDMQNMQRMGDQSFVHDAGEGGLAEVELGQLAVDKAADPRVKEFGQRMVTDHSKANDQLKQIASQRGISLPTSVSSKTKKEKERLSKLSGTDFDKAYMKLMVKDHEKDVSDFRQESQSGSDPLIKSFATQTLPTLQSHLKEAESIAPKGVMSENTTPSSQSR